MRIGEVIGTVTLAAWHSSLAGGRYVLAVPLALENLKGKPAEAEELVVYDDLGASPHVRIAISEGGEAAQPFHPAKKPVDAYCAALLDEIELD